MEFVDEPSEAQAFLVGIPVDQGSEFSGTKDAPAKVREKLFESFAQTKRFYDFSDIVEAESFEATMFEIERKFAEIFEYRKPVFAIGGNHSVTLPVLLALAKHYNNIGLVFIDAHPDCQKGYYPYGDVFAAACDIPEIKKKVLVGVRNASKYEMQFLRERRIPFFGVDMKAASFITRKFKDCDAVYVSLDIDAIDPAYAPATNWIEPAGFTSREILEFLNRISKLPIVGFDVVEIVPSKDVNDMTSSLAAKLIVELSKNIF